MFHAVQSSSRCELHYGMSAMPIGLLLVGLRNREQAAFGECSADELQAGGQVLLAEAVRD